MCAPPSEINEVDSFKESLLYAPITQLLLPRGGLPPPPPPALHQFHSPTPIHQTQLISKLNNVAKLDELVAEVIHFHEYQLSRKYSKKI